MELGGGGPFGWHPALMWSVPTCTTGSFLGLEEKEWISLAEVSVVCAPHRCLIGHLIIYSRTTDNYQFFKCL